MQDLTSLLLSSQPSMHPYQLDFLQDEDPIQWAANVCLRNAGRGLQLQAMRSAFTGQQTDDQSVIHLDTNRPMVVKAALAKISQGHAGHASLQLLSFDAVDQLCRFEPGKKFYEDVFREALTQVHPLGHYAKMTLWFSASQHVYEAHSDASDGFLFQLAGRKKVKVWPLPDECAEAVLYDHRDLPKRQSLPSQEFNLVPGHVLFIPGGAAHEVTVDSGYSSVSLSFHVGCPYPVLSLCRDLQASANGCTFRLPDEYCETYKTDITYFQPGRHYAAEPTRERMPESLRTPLCQTIDCDGCTKDELAQKLDDWWRARIQNSTYAGPYPRNP